MESEKNSEQLEMRGPEFDYSGNIHDKKKKNRRSTLYGCFKSDFGYPTVEESDVHGNFDIKSSLNKSTDDPIHPNPTHLIITVNGIIGSARDWRFAATQFLHKYPQDVIVHCSECNYSMLTFDGIDVMGGRLADEVISVVKRHPGLQKISFIGHSLGGLIARYTIAKLYSEDFRKQTYQENGESGRSKNSCMLDEVQGTIAGLEPVNFITFATPHLGLRGHKQFLEKIALRISWLLGRTGEHQFLTDTEEGKHPLLLQMAQDCEDLKFISALQSFKRCVAYSNAYYDYMAAVLDAAPCADRGGATCYTVGWLRDCVQKSCFCRYYILCTGTSDVFLDIVGWSTSSLRRENELPKLQQLPANSRYPHIINEETAKTNSSCKKAKANGTITDDMQETMLEGLTKVRWERVDVSFSGSKQRFFAHSTIQVKTLSLHSDGTDVIQHMVDKFLL